MIATILVIAVALSVAHGLMTAHYLRQHAENRKTIEAALDKLNKELP